MAIVNKNATADGTWTKVNISDTGSGDMIIQNTSDTQWIRYAFKATSPTTERGFRLAPGESVSRGTVEGIMWIRKDNLQEPDDPKIQVAY